MYHSRASRRDIAANGAGAVSILSLTVVAIYPLASAMAVVGIGLDDLIDLTNRCAISANAKKKENYRGSAIRISNVSRVSSVEILEVFNFGVITTLKMSPSSGEAEVRYADAEAAKDAAECYDGVCLFARGTPIRVEIMAEPGEREEVAVGDFLRRSRCSLCGSGSSGSVRSLESPNVKKVTKEQLDEEMDEYMREGERKRLAKKTDN